MPTYQAFLESATQTLIAFYIFCLILILWAYSIVRYDRKLRAQRYNSLRYLTPKFSH